MTDWTYSARKEWEHYWTRVRDSVSSSGADTTEVMDDIKRHIDSEAMTAQLSVVTGDDVRRILGQIGEPGLALPGERNGQAPLPFPRDNRSRSSESRPGYALLILGVILPALTLLIELATHMCAGAFFDPVPSVWHTVLVALVPLANGFAWLSLRKGRTAHLSKCGLANGLALAVAAYYAVIFLPLVLPGLVAVVFFGWGLLPLAPLFAFIATIVLRGKLRRSWAHEAVFRLPGLWTGFVLGLVSLSALELPDAATRIALQLAASDSAAARDRGVRWLRVAGDNERLLRACYERPRQFTDLVGLFMSSDKLVTQAEARDIYFRVSGQPFNTLAPPKLFARGGEWGVRGEEFVWDFDAALGGDAVAGPVKGLSLVSSRVDGNVEPDAALAYLEWTMEFKNVARVQREARAQIGLPPGAVVSRVTLWVNGQEREAAFAGRGQVREVYQKVAVQQRRDPVLVTTCGPDRVLMQCFPVPSNGGSVKVRIGITSPLVLKNLEEGYLRWPVFLDRNFSLAGELKTTLWVESKRPLEAESKALILEQASAKKFVLRGLLDPRELNELQAGVRVERAANAAGAWTLATGRNQIIRQRIRTTDVSVPSRVVLVVDGSRNMEEFYARIGSVLPSLPEKLEFSMLLASDETIELSGKPQAGSRALYQNSAERLRQSSALGGQDNIPALIRAWDLAAASTNGVIVWIHGPQPVLLEKVDALTQRFQRRPGSPRLFEIQTKVGPNRITEQLDGIYALESVPRLGRLEEDLKRLFSSWAGGVSRFQFEREKLELAALSESSSLVKASANLERLWAFEKVLQLAAARKFQEAIELAARHQIVTPLSGAVVLETSQQYQMAGLTPADPATVPAIPEPETWGLMILGVVLLWFGAKRRRRVAD
jgi:hypothetical protein